MIFTLKKSSWHYWIANFGEIRVRPEWDEGNDICSYTRAFIRGAFWLAMTGLAIALGITWIGASLWNLYEWTFNDAKIEPWTGVFLFIAAVFACLVACLAVKVKIDEYLDNRPPAPEKPPGFVKLAYSKFKNKTCFRLNFE